MTALQTMRLWWIEVVGVRRYRACVVSSDPERRYLERWRLTNIVTVPNAIEVPRFIAHRLTDPALPCRLVFVGNMAYGPNVDAVSYFAREVLPVIRRRLHDATLDVIGPGFPHELLSKLPSGVRVRGFVPDLPRALAGYEIYVAPLRLGGGTKLKVLTALAHGVPLVTTPVGAEGLHLEPGKHAAICRSSEEMARAVVRLHERPSEGFSMALAGHQLVKERFAWETVRQATASWLARQMPQAPATSG